MICPHCLGHITDKGREGHQIPKANHSNPSSTSSKHIPPSCPQRCWKQPSTYSLRSLQQPPPAPLGCTPDWMSR